MGVLEANTTLIYGLHIRESANDGSDFSNAAADYRVLFVGEDGLFHLKDSAGTVTTPSASAGAVTSSGLTMATSRLLGRTTASTGAIEEITLGTNLSFSGTTLNAASGANVPGWVSDFVGTTDSDNFFWDGNDLASFTEVDITGTSTWAEGDNLVSALISNTTADDVNAQLIAHSFSIGDEWVLPVQVGIPWNHTTNVVTGNRSAGIIFSDGTVAGSNCVIGHIQMSNDPTSGNNNSHIVGRHGTLTAVSTAPWVSTQQNYPSGWLYLKLKYSASNTFQLLCSQNGVQYSALGEADISKTMTPTHVGIVGWLQNAGTAQMTFGPLRKVA